MFLKNRWDIAGGNGIQQHSPVGLFKASQRAMHSRDNDTDYTSPRANGVQRQNSRGVDSSSEQSRSSTPLREAMRSFSIGDGQGKIREQKKAKSKHSRRSGRSMIAKTDGLLDLGLAGSQWIRE